MENTEQKKQRLIIKCQSHLDFVDRLKVLFGSIIHTEVTVLIPTEVETYNAFSKTTLIGKSRSYFMKDKPDYGYTAVEKEPFAKQVEDLGESDVEGAKDHIKSEREQLDKETEAVLEEKIIPERDTYMPPAPASVEEVNEEEKLQEEPDPEPQIIDTRIISAFPGVGKTYYYDISNGAALDSDSSDYSWLPQKEGEEKQRDPNFPNNYMEHIRENIGKVDTILVSSHKVVRDALKEAQLPFTLVYPEDSAESKEAMLTRYRDRGSDEAFLKQIGDNWDRFLGEMKAQEGCAHAVLPKGMYLSDYLENVDKKAE